MLYPLNYPKKNGFALWVVGKRSALFRWQRRVKIFLCICLCARLRIHNCDVMDRYQMPLINSTRLQKTHSVIYDTSPPPPPTCPRRERRWLYNDCVHSKQVSSLRGEIEEHEISLNIHKKVDEHEISLNIHKKVDGHFRILIRVCVLRCKSQHPSQDSRVIWHHLIQMEGTFMVLMYLNLELLLFASPLEF